MDKTPAETAEMAATAVETTGLALVTRANTDHRGAVEERLADEHPAATVETH